MVGVRALEQNHPGREAALQLAFDEACLRAAPRAGLAPLPRDRALQKLAAGLPLLHGEDVDPDVGACRELFMQLLDISRRFEAAESLGSEINRAVASGRLDLERALGEALADHQDHLSDLASWAGLPPAQLATLLGPAVQPSLRKLAASLEPLLQDLSAWDQGYCPVCGTRPELTRQDWSEWHSRQVCPRCGASWTGRVRPDQPGFRLELAEEAPDEALDDLLEMD